MREEKYNARYFRDSLPDWKRKKDPPLSRIFYRPVSFVLASFFTKLGIGANGVSNFSTLIGMIACIFMIIPQYWAGIAGALLINFWLVLDCTDGNIARAVKAEPYGEFVDATSSYLLCGLIFNFLGLRVYFFGGALEINPVIIVVLGGLASSFDTLMRLIYQKYVVVSRDEGRDTKIAVDGRNAGTIDKIRIKVDQNLNLGGILPLAILIGCIFNVLDVVIICWFFYFGMVCLATVLYLLRKVKG
jgi:phosphatidylglycerophosphate synthase